MGTNFYVEPKDKECNLCHRPFHEIHLGKSSVGWKFLLQANGFKYYKNWLEMKKWLVGKKIVDEYGKVFKRKEFIEWVENKQNTLEPIEVYYEDYNFVDGYKFYDNEFS